MQVLNVKGVKGIESSVFKFLNFNLWLYYIQYLILFDILKRKIMI